MIRSRIRIFIGYLISVYLILTGRVSNIINQALNGNIILSIYFHNPSKKTFNYLIQWLQKKGLDFISADELIKILKKEIPFPKGAVFLSIDDGWRENLSNVFRITFENKIPITLFATMDPIINNEGFWWSYIDKGTAKGFTNQKKEILKSKSNMERLKEVDKLKSLISIKNEAINIENLKQLSTEKNIVIGSHTFSHPILTNCNEEELIFEIGMSKIIIEKNINNRIKYFAYPNGRHNKREMDTAKINEYEAAFGTDPEYIMVNKSINLYNIPRFEISDNVSLMENICRLTGVWYYLNISKRDNA
jgi:peptidoglycan/xylan/chitin deacetylase (PgdA/CDA1 family)